MRIKKKQKQLLTNKGPELDGFAGEFYLTLKEELTPILLKLFQKFKRREDFQAHFMRPALSLFQNHIKTLQRKKSIGQYL